MSKVQFDLSVVIPVYNEEELIAESLEAIVATMRRAGLRYELVVVDDGSTDTSLSLINKAVVGPGHARVVRHEANLGSSEALRTGFRAARGRYVTHLDADLQFDPADVLRFYRCARHLHLSFVACQSDKSVYSTHRLVISRCANVLSHLLFGIDSRIDVNGINLIDADLLEKIRFSDRLGTIGVELITGAQDHGRPVLPLPVRVRPRTKGKSYFHFGLILPSLAGVLSLAMQRSKQGSGRKRKPAICLSFDLEEWRVPEHCGIEHPSNAATTFSEQGLRRILRLLEQKNVSSTFFVTGYYAEREAESVRAVQEQGHEVGCHSDEDVHLGGCTEERIRQRIRRATETLARVCGKAPRGFRAPLFSGSDTVRDHLMELGYLYDSSVHPAVVPGRYVDFRTPLSPFIVEKQEKSLAVFPISVIPLIRFPISWWWMRNIGVPLTMFGSWINLKRGRDVVLYLHPWEFAELPRIPGIPRSMTRGSGLKFVGRLEELITHAQNQGYEFTTMESLLK